MSGFFCATNLASFRNMKFKAENMESSSNSFLILFFTLLMCVIYRYPSKLAIVWVPSILAAQKFITCTEKAGIKCEKFYIYCNIFLVMSCKPFRTKSFPSVPNRSFVTVFWRFSVPAFSLQRIHWHY